MELVTHFIEHTINWKSKILHIYNYTDANANVTCN